jgi:anthranilate synthase component 1
MQIDQFRSLAKTYTAIPVHRVLMADTLTPVSVFLKLRENVRMPFLLESVEGGEKIARYSFIGMNPFRVLSCTDNTVSIEENGQSQELDGTYYELLQEYTNAYTEPRLPDLPHFTAGAVGYSSYDTVRMTERLPNPPPDDLNIPEAVWAFYDEIYAFDHVKHRILIIKTVRIDTVNVDIDELYAKSQQRLDAMSAILEQGDGKSGSLNIATDAIQSNIEKSVFEGMVETAKKHIYEGDIFQVVLSQRFSTRYEGDRFMIYRALRMVNPSPYMFYLDFGSYALIGASPEVLVRVINRKAEVLPIAGTRPRGKSYEEDLAFESDLLADTKELAEHVMLVDLGRNDLSRICASRTVHVTRSNAIERYSHVMHIVSNVEGELRNDATAVDALRYCFPAGTVSGAPKVRAMEIIDALEPTRRGPYAGAVGYFDFSGNMDTCIAIRTMVATDTMLHIQAGAGIVADSIPDNEYTETVNKARALMESIHVALKLS